MKYSLRITDEGTGNSIQVGHSDNMLPCLAVNHLSLLCEARDRLNVALHALHEADGVDINVRACVVGALGEVD